MVIFHDSPDCDRNASEDIDWNAWFDVRRSKIFHKIRKIAYVFQTSNHHTIVVDAKKKNCRRQNKKTKIKNGKFWYSRNNSMQTLMNSPENLFAHIRIDHDRTKWIPRRATVAGKARVKPIKTLHIYKRRTRNVP